MVGGQRIDAGLDIGEIARQKFRHVAIELALAHDRRAIVTRTLRRRRLLALAAARLGGQPLQRVGVAGIEGHAG